MKLLNRQVVRRHGPQGAPLCGYVAWGSQTGSVVVRRLGWETDHDDSGSYTDELSFDGGQTWGPSLATSVPLCDSSRFQHEFAAIFHPEQRLFLTFAVEHPRNPSESVQLRVARSQPGHTVTSSEILDLDLPQGLQISFAVPLIDSHQRVFIPVQFLKPIGPEDNELERHPTRPGFYKNAYDVALMTGEFDSTGSISWTLGQPVPFDLSTTLRGLSEGALASIEKNKLVMIMRGSNVGWGGYAATTPSLPGYKWVTTSTDGGQSWSQAKPLAFDDGSVPESSATGSSLFRSLKNGRLYWIGNLCLNGERPNGNFPRSPLVCAEVQEEPFALRSETLTILDDRQPGEDARLQLSNFKHFQDANTGDLVLYMTRYGERGATSDNWLAADLYEYRFSLDS